MAASPVPGSSGRSGIVETVQEPQDRSGTSVPNSQSPQAQPSTANEPAPPAARPTRRVGALSPSERERAQSARSRGLAAPYIPGGEAPDRAAAERTDRFYGRLLIVMVVVIVLSGFVFGIIANVIRLLGGG
jgi:hypothetical protein